MNPEKFLDSLVNYEKIPGYNYDLKAYEKFLAKLNNPHKKLKNIILIGGTKGKGSTAAIINSCLISCSYKIGLFTSPHLKKINERITVNGRQITDKEFEEYIKIVKPYINFNTRIGARTYFEVLTTIAFFYFIEKDVDFTILEVGLGGRLDATNVTNPIISAMTKIGYDHTNLLGNTLSEIAFEKAGIIKPSPFPPPQVGEDKGGGKVITISTRQEHGRLITIHQRPSVEKVLKRVCRKRNSKITFAESQHKVKIKKMSLMGSYVNISGELGKFNAFLPVAGQHQIQNLLIVLSVLNELKKMGFKISISAIQKGIRRTDLHGRFELISPKSLALRERAKKPLIIFDCAHNQDSFEALNKNLNLIPNFNNPPTPPLLKGGKGGFYLIFGCSMDKKINYAIEYIFPKAREVLLVKTDNPRSMEPSDMYVIGRKYQKKLIIASSVQKAIEYIKKISNKTPTIIITGSFYLWQDEWTL